MTYGINAAYLDLLQPALLRVYEWASKEWHRFTKADEVLSGTIQTAARFLQTIEVLDETYGLNSGSKRRAQDNLRE